MHKYIRYTGTYLILWQSISKLGIHYSKLTSVIICCNTFLYMSTCHIISKYCRITGFRACRRNSQNSTYRQRFLHLLSLKKELFYIRIGTCHTNCNKLCSIYNTSAAYRQYKLRSKLDSLLCHFLCLTKKRIRHHSTKQNNIHALRL